MIGGALSGSESPESGSVEVLEVHEDLVEVEEISTLAGTWVPRSSWTNSAADRGSRRVETPAPTYRTALRPALTTPLTACSDTGFG